MHPCVHAQTDPGKPAIIMAATGETVSYGMLEERSNQGAHLFRALGLKPGDVIAIFMDNNARYLEITWAAQRAGLYYTCISSRLTAGEVEYIVRDCGAKIFIASHALAKTADELTPLFSDLELYIVGGAIPGYARYEDAAGAMATSRIADETAGIDMLYSSGTTGRPKGIKIPLTGQKIDEPNGLMLLAAGLFHLDKDTVYLSPAPLYHSAPLRWSMSVHRLGGTVVVMDHFDAEGALRAIQTHRCTASQWVPTMFVRMLKLPEEARARYDVSSMKTAIHAAAPCPKDVKQKMIAWWGPVLYEYYAGTEGNGFCFVTSEEWLAHPGTVGKAILGEIHICDETGKEVPLGDEGVVYFANGPVFEYHNDPKKTSDSRHPEHGWTTLGDVGRVDAEGYLYLTDRKAFMIISGGVNIYPQETENILIMHPRVADAAVIGVPNEDFGEEVKAVVQPVDWRDAGPELAEDLIAYCRERLSHVKCPKSVDFERELPRHPTGKLYKRLIRDRYWGKRESRIV